MAKKKKKSSPFDVWMNRRIKAPLLWQKGINNLKGKPSPAIFRLKPEKVPDGSGGTALRFRVKFTKGKLPGYWKHVVLQPMGSKSPPMPKNPLPPLPPKGNLTAAKVRIALRRTIDSLNSSRTKIRRLEGFIPVLKGGVPALDEVRMVYFPKILQRSQNDPDPIDFVLISFRGPGDDPNGGGSGPPD